MSLNRDCTVFSIFQTTALFFSTVVMSKNITVLRKIIYISLQDQFTNKNTNGTWSNILVGLPHYWNSDPYHTQQVMMEDTPPGTHTVFP